MPCVNEDSPDMSSSWLMLSLSMRGGSLLEKKSLSAVATAFTGMSSECMSTLPSETQFHHYLTRLKIVIKNHVYTMNIESQTNLLRISETAAPHELGYLVLCKYPRNQAPRLQ